MAKIPNMTLPDFLTSPTGDEDYRGLASLLEDRSDCCCERTHRRYPTQRTHQTNNPTRQATNYHFFWQFRVQINYISPGRKPICFPDTKKVYTTSRILQRKTWHHLTTRIPAMCRSTGRLRQRTQRKSQILLSPGTGPGGIRTEVLQCSAYFPHSRSSLGTTSIFNAKSHTGRLLEIRSPSLQGRSRQGQRQLIMGQIRRQQI